MHRRHLRRVGRPRAAQADAGALLARLPAPAARAVRDRRRGAQRGDRRRLPRADEGGGAALRARRVPPGRVGRARGRDALLLARGLRSRGRGPARAAARPRSTASAARRATASTTSPSRRARSARSSSAIAERRADERLDAADHREAVRPRPRLGARAERAARASTSTRARSSASTTTSARRPSRTCWRCGSRTASSSRSGTASSSTTCRSRSPSRSGSRAAPAFYEQAGRDPRRLPEPPAAAASRSRRWSRRSTSPPSRCATRR